MELALHSGNTCSQKLLAPQLRHCVATTGPEQSACRMLGYRNPAHDEPLEAGMMKARQSQKVAVSSRSVLFASSVAIWLAAFGAAVLDRSGAARLHLEFAAAALPAKTEPAVAAQPAAIDHPVVVDVAKIDDVAKPDVARSAESATAPVAETAPALEPTQPAAEAPTPEARETVAAAPAAEAHEATTAAPEPVMKLASADPTELLPADTPQQEPAAADTPNSASTNDAAKTDAGTRRESVGSVEVLDECLVVEACVDRFLWALYQRTPKEDSIKEHEQRKVTVKRKGKMVTVTRTFTKLVDEDFAWKDPKAADRSGLSLRDYVIGGMDKSFKLKLFHTLLAAEAAGLSPGITSAFRDDYRQAIASGLKAASNRSYHGGSSRGGYGHGLAADIVSVRGETRDQRWVSSEKLWKWIDANGKALGIARPYLDHDPPHVAPVDGQEYASHRGGASVRHAAAGGTSKGLRAKRIAARGGHGAPKRQTSVQKLAKQSKVRAG
jgi:hypothetical protein